MAVTKPSTPTNCRKINKNKNMSDISFQDKQIRIICLSASSILTTQVSVFGFQVYFFCIFLLFQSIVQRLQFDFKAILYKSWMPKSRLFMHSMVSAFNPCVAWARKILWFPGYFAHEIMMNSSERIEFNVPASWEGQFCLGEQCVQQMRRLMQPLQVKLDQC